MKTAIVQIEGVSPYSQSRYHNTEKLPRELHKNYELRTWRERMHATDQGYIFIPPMSFMKSLCSAAKYMGTQIPGKGKATYTKHFTSGIIVPEGIVLGIKREDVPGEWFLVPHDGKAGGGKKVEKCFGVVPTWGGRLTMHVIDELITEDALQTHLEAAGLYIGIGRFRPENGGLNGRFKATVKSFK